MKQKRCFGRVCGLLSTGLLAVLLAGVVVISGPAYSADKKAGKNKKAGKKNKKARKRKANLFGRHLAASLAILNKWDQKSEDLNQLYSSIYNLLDKNKGATFAEVAQDAKVQELFKKAGMVHVGGPLLGCVAPDSVKVWLRTTKPAKVSVTVLINDKQKTFGPVESTVESDLTAIVPITGLKPNTTYTYKVQVDGKESVIPENATITTPPADADKNDTRIAFGTCPHRGGLGNPELWAQVLKFKPNAMLAYGDIASNDRRDHLGLHRADYVLRDLHPAWSQIEASVPVYASWDDHDYSSNDGWGLKSFDDKGRRGVRKVFTQAWNNPYYGLGDEGGGIFTHTRIGCADVIMTDNRYFREAVEKGSRGKKNAFLGAEQMAWLKKTILACKGPFIIITCGTMWDDVAAKGKDSWGKYDSEGREEIYQLIEKHKIPGVLFLSGDRHGARIFRIPRSAGHNFYEFEVATLGGLRSGTPANSPGWKTQLYGQQSVYAYGQFTFDLSGADPTVTHRLMQDSGKVLFELKLTRSQLTPK